MENLESLQWGKLVVNSALNPLGALLRETNEVFAEREAAREVFLAVIRESAGVASAMGIPLPYDDPAEHALGVVRGTAGNRCSMLQDLENHRPTEIDAINGAIVRAAAKADVPAPWNGMLVQADQGGGTGRKALDRIYTSFPRHSDGLSRHEESRKWEFLVDRRALE